jgi:hypothetical protein
MAAFLWYGIYEDEYMGYFDDDNMDDDFKAANKRLKTIAKVAVVVGTLLAVSHKFMPLFSGYSEYFLAFAVFFGAAATIAAVLSKIFDD